MGRPIDLHFSHILCTAIVTQHKRIEFSVCVRDIVRFYLMPYQVFHMKASYSWCSHTQHTVHTSSGCLCLCTRYGTRAEKRAKRIPSQTLRNDKWLNEKMKYETDAHSICHNEIQIPERRTQIMSNILFRFYLFDVGCQWIDIYGNHNFRVYSILLSSAATRISIYSYYGCNQYWIR